MRNCVVACGQSLYSAKSVDKNYVAIEITSIEVRKEETTQFDPHLDPAGAIFIKPDADMLRAQLLLRGHVAHSHPHGTERLQIALSQSCGYSVSLVRHLKFLVKFDN